MKQEAPTYRSRSSSLEANGKDAKITRNVNITGLENAGKDAVEAVAPVVVADACADTDVKEESVNSDKKQK